MPMNTLEWIHQGGLVGDVVLDLDEGTGGQATSHGQADG
jgi:hypothetical protein